MDAKVLLRSAFFVDVLSEAKIFSLVTQKKDAIFLEIVESMESTKRNYERLLKKIQANSDTIFDILPTLKTIVNEIESNEDGETVYQNQKVSFYLREKKYIKDYASEVVQNILACYEKRYGHVYSDSVGPSASIVADDGDSVLFDVCRILNSNVWPRTSTDTEEEYSNQIAAVLGIYTRYKSMDVFPEISPDSIVVGFIDLVSYSKRYFDTEKVKPVDLWSQLLSLGKNKSMLLELLEEAL